MDDQSRGQGGRHAPPPLPQRSIILLSAIVNGVEGWKALFTHLNWDFRLRMEAFPDLLIAILCCSIGTKLMARICSKDLIVLQPFLPFSISILKSGGETDTRSLWGNDAIAGAGVRPGQGTEEEVQGQSSNDS
jgi:hypothetical protein